MKIYSDISLIDVSQSVSQGQNTYILVKDPNDNTIRRTQLQVNGNTMDSNGNIATALTNVLVGPSSSGTDPNNLVASSSGTVTGSISTGTVWVVNNNSDDATKNGLSYIFKNTPGTGQWYQLATLNQAGADIRYVKIASDTTQNISSSLNITGSIYWDSGSGAVFPGAGVTASVVVLGDDNKLYITGAYGIGGNTGTPSAPLNSVQFNDNSAFGGNETFTFIPPTASNSSVPISSSLLSLLGRETLSGSLVLRNPASISGSIYTASAWTSSLTLQVIGTSSFTGSVTISSSLVVTGSTVLRDGTTTIQGNSATTGNVLLVNNSTPTNILTISNNRTSSFNGNTFVSGALVVSRSTDNTATVVGSGSINPLLNVLGSQGQLFSVYDTLSGSLFSVNDISGLPIVDVRSDITTLIGSYQAPALHTSRRIVTVAGSNIVYNGIPTASYNAAIIDYNLTSASYAKVGSIMTAWSSSIITAQTEYATASVAGGNYPTMSLQISGANLIITASSTDPSWVIKTIIRSI